MSDFAIHILGCGSALPTMRHLPSSQVVSLRDKLYMIDCGEGTQLQMRYMRVKFNRLNHIFISHLHGDHCFGLPGLISTLGLLGRTADLFVYGPDGLEDYLQPVLNMFNKKLSFHVCFRHINPFKHELIMEDRSLRVYSIPLSHRIPACGFLFEEKAKEAHLIREMADFYQIPVRLLRGIKQGEDFVTPEGERIPNSWLTRPSLPPKKYAYCSDTAFFPAVVPIIKGVDLLYHEATFAETDINRARDTGHSTASQAAEIARLAQVRKLVIGHFSSRYENEEVLRSEASCVFPDTVLARERMVIAV